MDIMVQSKELTSHEQANLKMLRTVVDTKWKNQMPEQKVIDA